MQLSQTSGLVFGAATCWLGAMLLVSAASTARMAGEPCYGADYHRHLTEDCPTQMERLAATRFAGRVSFLGDVYELHVALSRLFEEQPELDSHRFRRLALSWAADEAIRRGREDVAVYAVLAGAFPNARFEFEGGPERDAWSLLFQAAHRAQVRTVQELLRAGANPREIDSHGRSALVVTAQGMRDRPANYDEGVQVLQALLAAGADPSAADAQGLNLFGHVVLIGRRSDEPFADLLLHGVATGGPCERARPAGAGGSRLLHAFAFVSDESRLRRTLDLGAPPDAWRDAQGRTALAIVALRSAPWAPEAIAAMVAAGADPNAIDSSGHTPLFHAVNGAKPLNGEGVLSAEVVLALLAAGADRAHQDDRGLTAADVAAPELVGLVR